MPRVLHRGLATTLLLAILLLPNAAAAAAASAQSTTAVTFSGAAAKQLDEALAVQIGSRPAGSGNFDAAVQYAQDQLRQWGYQPALQSFPVQTYDDRGSQLEVTSSPEGTGVGRISADTLVYSIAGQVEAPLQAAGLGGTEELAAVDIHGKIALLKRGNLRFSDKVANAAAAGAVAVVIYNDGPGRVQGSLVQQEAIPALTISGDDGQRLVDQLATGPVQARLAVDGSIAQRGSSNVVAELPGTRTDGANIVIGAHLDTVSAGPGANDNGSGSAVVLELAHELAQVPQAERPTTLRLVLFGAEELGLYGSRYYVDSLSDAERQSIVAMVNLDMVGVGTEWRFGGTDNLVQLALGATNNLGQRGLPLRGPLAGASDHASFLGANIPAVFIYRTDDPNYHTANDRAEFVDADALQQAGTIALKLVQQLQ